VKPDEPTGERVLIIGDSMMRQGSLTVAFGIMGAGVETLVEPVNASGLVSGPTNWDQRAAQLISQFRPTVVMIQFVGNFSWPYWSPYHPPGENGSSEWNDWVETTKNSDGFIDRFVEAGRRLTGLFLLAGVRVYWFEPPPFPPAFGPNPTPDKLWARWKVDLPQAFPDVHMMSVRSSVANDDGTFKRFKTICGVTYEIRWELDGGVHFTSDGAGTYGRAMARSIADAEGWADPPQQCPGRSD